MDGPRFPAKAHILILSRAAHFFSFRYAIFPAAAVLPAGV
jgi:hypothetical protein